MRNMDYIYHIQIGTENLAFKNWKTAQSFFEFWWRADGSPKLYEEDGTKILVEKRYGDISVKQITSIVWLRKNPAKIYYSKLGLKLYATIELEQIPKKKKLKEVKNEQ